LIPHNESIGSYFKQARERAGLTRMEVAKKIGYTSTMFISTWERGVKSIPAKHLNTLMKLYKLDPDAVYKAVLPEVRKELKGTIYGTEEQ
jgi:transcriptional regulator with XRE-family HTH domain